MKKAKPTYLFGLLVFLFLHSCDTKQERTLDSKTKSFDEKEELTFAEDIAPIIHQNCTPCHRPGEAGPFDLITHKDVLKRAKTIRQVVTSRFMPPWPADRTYQNYVGERGLSDDEIERIANWIDAGSPLGDEKKPPTPPDYPPASQLGNPDLVLEMTKPYKIEGKNEDVFLMMKIPFEIPNDTFIRTIEFVPDNRQLLHHMNGHLVNYAPGQKKDVFEGDHVLDMDYFGDQHTLYRQLGILNDDGTYPTLTASVVNYLPGAIGGAYPEGIGGFQMNKKGALLIKGIHYGPTPVDEFDQSKFNIFFAEKPPERPVKEIIMGTLGISDVVPPLVIPPDSIKRFYTQARVEEDISLLTVNPHMHLLGQSFWAYAVPPSGDTIPLIRIKKWDFRWQYFYTFKKMIKIPKGSLIRAEAVFDNTAANPHNPFDPPQVVSEKAGSMRSSDEMFQFIINYVPYKNGDEFVSLENPRAETP